MSTAFLQMKDKKQFLISLIVHCWNTSLIWKVFPSQHRSAPQETLPNFSHTDGSFDAWYSVHGTCNYWSACFSDLLFIITFKYLNIWKDYYLMIPPPWLLLSCSRYTHDLRKVQRSTLTCHVGEGASATPYWGVLIPGDSCKCKIFISCFSILLFIFLSTLSVSLIELPLLFPAQLCFSVSFWFLWIWSLRPYFHGNRWSLLGEYGC